MSGRWDKPGVPHKGWFCIDVEDRDEPTETCAMCGNERIRFVHIMQHQEYPEDIGVGCICAEKMSDDYVGPKERERKLRNKAARKSRWLTRDWRVSAKGNEFLNVDGFNITIFQYRKGYKAGKWGFKVGDDFGPKGYTTTAEAKLAAFEELWEHLTD